MQVRLAEVPNFRLFRSSALNTEYKLAIAKATVSTILTGQYLRLTVVHSCTRFLVRNLPYRVITNSLAVHKALLV